MKNLQGTKTAENLAKAFAGECQARNRYTFYSRTAAEEGLKEIASVFLEIADNERAHAKIFFDFLIEGLGAGVIKVNGDYPIGFGNTEQNLKYAAEGEKAEWGTIYPAFAEEAKTEGFSEVEAAFRKIIQIEGHHEKLYLKFFDKSKNKALFKSNTSVSWKCRNCGYIYEGTDAPVVCPTCLHPQGYFEIL